MGRFYDESVIANSTISSDPSIRSVISDAPITVRCSSDTHENVLQYQSCPEKEKDHGLLGFVSG